MKRIYILGAGSSIGHSNGVFPSILNFFSAANALGLYKKLKLYNIEEYGNKVLGRNIFRKDSKIDIESFFTLIEIEIEKNSSIENIILRQELLRLIQELLLQLGKNFIYQEGEYNLLLETLKPEDSIITFNWDILLDVILGREIVLKERYGLNKAVEKTNHHYENFVVDLSAFSEQTWGGLSVSEPYEEWVADKGYYLKVHGSIDWFYCSNDSCRGFNKVFPVISANSKHYCSECHEQLGLLIIPPVLNKTYRQYPLIKRIWNLASKEITTANEIIIWGYSLPPTDFYASWLLRQARKGPLKKLMLINPQVVKKARKRVNLNLPFIERYSDLYHKQIGKDSLCLFETYEDFKNKLNVFDKYSLTNKVYCID